MLFWFGGFLFVGIKKLILYLLGVHTFLLFVLAMLVLLFILMWEFRRKAGKSVYAFGDEFEPSLAPGLWQVASVVIPELKMTGRAARNYKMERLCRN